MGDKREVAVLGDGEVIVKRTPDGTFQAIRGHITLSLKNKEIVSIPGGGTMITSYGFDSLNKVAGLTTLYPPRIPITVDRRGYPETLDVENPYIEYDDDGAIRVITVECYAIGLSPIGNWVITQERLRYDLRQYFISEVWSKVKKMPATGKFISEEARAKLKDQDENMWIKVISNWGLHIDPRHEEITKVLTGHLTRQKFAERIASTICRRNAMKRHPAIGKSEVHPRGGEARVLVYGWQHDLTADQVNNMARLTTSGKVPPQVELRSEQTDVEYGKSELETVEAEVVSNNLDQKNGKPKDGEEEQSSIFAEDDSLDDRSKKLVYLGSKEEELGEEKFVEIISSRVEHANFVRLEDLDEEDLDAAIEALKETNAA